MAMIQIPAKSIVGNPKLNIANDNTYESVEYTKQDRYETYEEITTTSLSYCEQTPVSKSSKLGDNDVILYSPYLSDYKIIKENGNPKPNINNGDFTFIGQYKISNNDNVTPDEAQEGLLLKVNIQKKDINIDYYDTQITCVYSENQNQIYIGDTLYVDKSGMMRNVEITENFRTDISLTNVYFSNENDALNHILYDYVNASDSSKNMKIIKISTLLERIIVDKGNSLDLYFPIMNYLISDTYDYTRGESRLDSIRINYNIYVYAKSIVSNSEEVNEGAKYSLPDNELLAEQTTYNGTSIYDQISNSIVSEYEKGKFSVDLTCLYMEYRGALLADTIYTGQDGQMVSVGDIIIPCKVGDVKIYGENVVLRSPALAVNKNNVPYAFKVIKSEIDTTDSQYIKNNICAVELAGDATINVNIDEFYHEPRLKIFINGKEVAWHTNDKLNARIGDLLEFEYENDSYHEIRVHNAIGFDENRGIHFGKGLKGKFCVYNDGINITLYG